MKQIIVFNNINSFLLLCFLFLVIYLITLFYGLKNFKLCWYKSFSNSSKNIVKKYEFKNNRLLKNIALKEFIKIERNIVQFSQFLLFIAMIALYYYNIYVISKSAEDAYIIIILFNMIFSSFIVSGIAVRYSYSTFSDDKTGILNFFILPVSFMRFFYSKFIIHFLFISLFSVILNLSTIIFIKMDAFLIVYNIIQTVIFSFLITSFAFLFGIIFIDLSDRPIVEKCFSTGGIINMILTLFIIILIVIMQIPFFFSKYNITSYSNNIFLFILSIIIPILLSMFSLKYVDYSYKNKRIKFR